MEPRPLNKPQRSIPAQPVPSMAPPPVDQGNWTPPSAQTPGYAQPTAPPDMNYGGGGGDGYESSAGRGAWYEPPAAVAPSPTQQHGYSPGPALTPIDGGGARFLGPVLALLVLAAVVGAVVFVVFRVFDDGGRETTAGSLAVTETAQSLAAASDTATAAAAVAATEEAAMAVASAEETAAPNVEATEAAEEEAAAEPTMTPEPESTRPIVSARSMIPSAADLPDGYQRTEDDKRARDAVAASFSDEDAALALLSDWGWRENAYRTFEIPEANSPSPNATNYINISIHRFGDDRGAADALTYFADEVSATQGLEEVEVEQVGDQARALTGALGGSNVVVLYVRTDNYLVRIGGSSPQGDPTEDAIAVAELIVD